MNILQTQGLTKKYRKTMALDNVTMTVKEGDIYGFVGKNGAGKTTLIRVITGVANQTHGKYGLFESTSEKELNKARSQMGAVVETPALYMELNAKENLMHQCVLYGINEPEKLVRHLLEVVDLAKLIDNHPKKKVRNYSLGMKQRLGIAMALVGNPKFLVLDEPNNGLDPEGIYDMRQLLLKLNRENKVTILISSHVLSELAKLCTIFGFIEKGRLIKEITAEQLEGECAKSIRIKMDKQYIAESMAILKELNYVNFAETDEGIAVYEQNNGHKIVNALAKRDIPFTGYEERQQDLEEYFLKLIGSSRHG